MRGEDAWEGHDELGTRGAEAAGITRATGMRPERCCAGGARVRAHIAWSSVRGDGRAHLRGLPAEPISRLNSATSNRMVFRAAAKGNPEEFHDYVHVDF